MTLNAALASRRRASRSETCKGPGRQCQTEGKRVGDVKPLPAEARRSKARGV